MGIDINHKYDRKVRRKAPKSEDPYLRVLVKLYRYLAKRLNTSKRFNEVVLKRFYMSKRNRPPLSIARIVRYFKKPGNEKKIVVCVGTVTDDKRIYKIPAMTICALRFTSAARARIIKAGGDPPPPSIEPASDLVVATTTNQFPLADATTPPCAESPGSDPHRPAQPSASPILGSRPGPRGAGLTGSR